MELKKISFNFEAKLAEYEFVHSNTLFPIDPKVATNQGKCPFCFCKLYEMRGKPFLYCKSKSHKNRFIISKDKVKQTIPSQCK